MTHSYRHINDLKNEDWFQRPWLMLGTGGSLDNFNPKDWKDHNIAAVYDAYYACDFVDVLFVSDDWNDSAFGGVKYWENKNIKYVATRSINHKNISNLNNVVMWDYDCDLKNYNVRLFYDYDQYPCSNTSSFIVMWLGKFGVKEIKTFGIDGGCGVSKFVSEHYSKALDYNYDFTHENGGVYGHASNYGIKLLKQ